MSEKFNSRQERADAIDEVRDFVAVDSMGRARVPAGSGSKGGTFLSDHEIKMIEAHASEIYDGLDNRENEALIDAVGVLEEPEHVRESLEQNGFIDEDDDWSNSEVMSMVEDARKDVDAYYAAHGASNEKTDEAETTPVAGKRRADVETDAPSQAEGYVRKQDRVAGRHRAENTDEANPIFDELLAKYNRPALSQEAHEGESLEEYEERQSGKHSKPSADDLEILPVDGADASNSADDLELLPVDDDEQEAAAPRASRLQRFATPSGIAAEASAWAASRERGSRRRNRVIALLGGAALAAGTAYFLIKGHDIRGGHGGGSGTGSAPSPTHHHPVIPGTNVHHHAETVRVNPGDGEIKVTQRILADHGVRVNTTQAQQIGEHAGVHDILKGDDSYAHSGSTMDRIGDTGRFKIRKGITAKLLGAAKQLKLK